MNRFPLQTLQAATLSFTFSLTLDDGEEEYNGVKLTNYGLHEMIDNTAYFTLRLPQKGLYRFIIYGKDSDQEVGALNHSGIMAPYKFDYCYYYYVFIITLCSVSENKRSSVWCFTFTSPLNQPHFTDFFIIRMVQ
jgi:hypothetical protein